ncbi:transposase [Peribacillus cavernae]|nr:transposase [Peribacillus cavernae]
MLQKAFNVSQSKEGFERFYQRIMTAMKESGKTEVIVGIEPTGHYWLNLAYFLDDRGIPLAMTNPMHVKRSKELDYNLPKHDAKDALVIARLVKDGRFSYPRILKGVEAARRCQPEVETGRGIRFRKQQADPLDGPVFPRVCAGISVIRKNGTRCFGTYPFSKRSHRERAR